jgi:hypothetical protein
MLTTIASEARWITRRINAAFARRMSRAKRAGQALQNLGRAPSPPLGALSCVLVGLSWSCSRPPNADADKEQREATRVVSTATGGRPASKSSGNTAQVGPGGQRPLSNPEALIPSPCYTKTDGRHNPCYVCHQNPIEDDGHENRLSDGYLQGDYNFSEFAEVNHWTNLFVDRSRQVAQISDDVITRYVNEDNYTPLLESMQKNASFQGYKPDLVGLARGRVAFDREGLARDGSAWLAFNYMPMPSTFWPTNGSTDDVMIRLPLSFRATRKQPEHFSRDVYLANLAILEAAIKNLDIIDVPLLDERKVGVDLDRDGKLGMAQRVARLERYVGAAEDRKVDTFIYPRGTEFLHTVRYLGTDAEGETTIPPRMKEVRYMVKHAEIPKFALAGLYDNETQEKIEGNPPYFADFRDRGIDNGFGWRLQGFIENGDGELRPNTYEETLFCMGCHSTIGTTIDKVFSFARKIDGPRGFGYVNLRGMPDAPAHGEKEGQILTYLKRTGGGSEFRNNDEMQKLWFRPDGSVDADRVEAAGDVFALITPSRERAMSLNKAYRVIVEEQSFLKGRDATVSPPKNVLQKVEDDMVPLAPEHRYNWDIRLDWPAP